MTQGQESIACIVSEPQAKLLRGMGVTDVCMRYYSAGLLWRRNDAPPAIDAFDYSTDLSDLCSHICHGEMGVVIIGMIDECISLTTIEIGKYLIAQAGVQSVIIATSTPAHGGMTLEVFEMRATGEELTLRLVQTYKHLGTPEARLRFIVDAAYEARDRLVRGEGAEIA